MAEAVDVYKLKLAELKQECATRGLEVKGNKQDLINRLQAYFVEHAEEEVNEEDVLAEETEEEHKTVTPPPKEETPVNKENQQTADKKVVKISPGMSQNERLQKRAERFNVPVSSESKKAARAARFGLSSAKGTSTDIKTTIEEDEKLKKRKERFGILTSAAGVIEDTEAKKRKRAERFGFV